MAILTNGLCETAMAGMLLEPTVGTPAARQLLQDLFVSEADIIPNTENKQLRVKIHAGSRPAVNKSLRDLFEKLNESEITYLETDMKLVYKIPEIPGLNFRFWYHVNFP